MKKTMVLAVAIGLSAFAQAAPWTEADLKCGTGVYCVEELFCVGQLDGKAPRGMHEDYYTQAIRMQAFKSTKNLGNGQKTLVDSLEVSEGYYGNRPDLTIEEARAEFSASSTGYGAPARRRGKSVTAWGIGFSEGFELKIISIEKKDGYELHKLEGSEKTVGSVVADYTFNYVCEAKVVKAPSRVDDWTRN